jgi:hypothetical protein
MKETFEQYLQRLKDRRTEDEYKYTDEDFKKYIYYIFDCYEKGMSVYKCLEFMYFAERDMDDQLFNRESKQEIISSEEDAKIFIDTTINVPEPNEKLKKAFREYGKQETLEEALERIRQESFTCCSLSKSINYVTVGEREKTAFYKGAKWSQERSYSEEEVLKMLEYAVHESRMQDDKMEDYIVNETIFEFKKNKICMFQNVFKQI